MSGYHIEWKNKGDRPVAERSKAVEDIGVAQDVVIAEQEVPETVAEAVVDVPVVVAEAVEPVVSASVENEVADLVAERKNSATSSNGPWDNITVPTSLSTDAAAGPVASEMSKQEVKEMLKRRGRGGSKWLPFWLIGWGIGLVLLILGVALTSPIVLLFGYLFWLAGSVFGILWLVEMLS